MKNNYQLLSRQKVDAFQLPDEIIRELKKYYFIAASGVSDTTLLSQLQGIAQDSIKDTPGALPKFVAFISQRSSTDESCRVKRPVQAIHFLNAEFLQQPIERLRLSPRGKAIIRRLQIKTLADLFDYGLVNLQKFRNVGETTCRNIDKSVLDLIGSQSLNGQTCFRFLLESLLPRSPYRRDIVKARFGFDDGKGQTLRRIGQRFGVTSERIRQIIVDELRKMTVGRAGVALNLLRQRVDIILIRAGDAVSLEDIVQEDFFEAHRKTDVLFAVYLLCALFPDKYTVVDNQYVTKPRVAESIRLGKSMGGIGKPLRHMLPAEE